LQNLEPGHVTHASKMITEQNGIQNNTYKWTARKTNKRILEKLEQKQLC